MLPCFMGDNDALLVKLPVKEPPPVRDLWLTAYPDIGRSPVMRMVMTFLADIIGRECPIRIA